MEKKKAGPVYIELIRQIMAEKQLSQAKFAEKIGVNQTTVSQWLMGRKKPGYDNIEAICKQFEITPDEFFGQ